MMVLLFIGGTLAYLGIGYVWAMVFIHHLTEGYWERESLLGYIQRTPMGVGTALTFTIIWPITMGSIALITIGWLASELFKADLWKKLYRLH